MSYTFDDDNNSQIANYGQLQALGVPFTFYLWTGRTQASNSVWTTAVHDGHEIGNHTQSHTSNGTTPDILAATTFIMQNFGVTPFRAWLGWHRLQGHAQRYVDHAVHLQRNGW